MKASAGSGKTYSLARHYISLLLKSSDRYAYRHILAVTFTNKATDEMKSRILKELHVMSTDPSHSDYRDYFIPSVFPDEAGMQDKARKVLQDILHDYSAFAVSTIDRFFQQTLKAFSREIGHFASYQVELDRDSLVAESVDRILDSLTEEDGSLLSWLTANVLEQIEQGGRYNMDANLLEMAKRLKSPQRQTVIEQTGIDPDAISSKENLMAIRERCRKIRTAFKEEVQNRANAVVKTLEQCGVHPDETSYKFMSAIYNYVEVNETDGISQPSNRFMTLGPDPEKWFSKAKAKTLLPMVSSSLPGPMDSFCELWDKEYSVYNTARILDDQLYGLGVASELSKTFQELMKEKNVLCLDDSNAILRDIIDGSDAPFVYEKIGVRFEHFLLDEFQDTSEVQWKNFSPLLHNSESQDGENLIVGDVKQSIYRWRGSDWKLLDQIVPSEFDGYKEEILETNYRSLSNIVTFNNLFFEQAAMALDRLAGYEGNGPMSRIYADVQQKVAKKDKPGGNVCLTFCNPKDQLDQVLLSVERAREAGARLSDIAVLVRNNKTGEQVASSLIANGISVITDDSLKVKNALTVRRLVSLMSNADNPEDTVTGYLSEMMDVSVPDSGASLIDMVEGLLREIQSGEDDSWRGELLHVQSFMDCVQDYVAKNGNSLRGFLKNWDGVDPSISSPSSGECVRVMTIHKSKGLDFPYVIIPFAETITMFKADNHWCRPELKGTSLEDVADGIYDVTLSESAEKSLFADDYRREAFLQHVDNINTLYVAMTRAALGMHIISQFPSQDCCKAVEKGVMPEFKNFSHVLYWYVSTFRDMPFIHGSGEDSLWFEVGQMVDFNAMRKSSTGKVADFPIAEGSEYPSFEVKGRLRLSEDAADFFLEDTAGVSASSRIRGIVLHDILAQVDRYSDLRPAVDLAVMSGHITSSEGEVAFMLLSDALKSVEDRGWFAEDASKVYKEASLMDTDGQIYRPDRVLVKGDTVVVVDYKFGEHQRKYEKQVGRYMNIWRRMGYGNVSGFLWYVDASRVVEV